MTHNHLATLHHVVIIGGGFGGLYTAKALRHGPVRITLIDRRNFHLFQPLLYQVATGGLSPADIAYPLRAVFSRNKNVKVLQAEVTDLDPQEQRLTLKDGSIGYDTLVVSTGVTHHYFGNDGWAPWAPSLKTLEDAVDIRHRVFIAFEAAERETDPAKRAAWLTFVIIGGGPTGVELAGALAELTRATIKEDFRHINPAEATIVLLEGADRILPPYPPELSVKAQKMLENMGVKIQTNTFVTQVEPERVTMKQAEAISYLASKTILWAAGMKASSMGNLLAERTGVELDRMGRVMVEPDMSIANHANIFVIGDLAHYAHVNGQPLPGVAPVAMQQGYYLAKLITAQVTEKAVPQFNYIDKGSLAVIGRNKAIAQVGPIKTAGIFAWLIWIFIHIAYLIGYDRRIVVLFQWAINYFTRRLGARLITEYKGEDPFPMVTPHQSE